MKRFLCGAVLLFGALTLRGEPAVPELTARVVDTAHVFSPGGVDRLTRAIRHLEQAAGGQMAVLTVPSLAGEDVESFGIRVAEKWKLGKKGRDNGAILLLAVKERRSRLEIGYGWEGKINDARAGDVLRGMIPALRAGDYDGAALYAVNKVCKFLTGRETGEKAAVRKRADAGNDWGVPILVFSIILLVVYASFSKGGSSRGGGWFGGGGGSFRGGGGGSFSGGGGSFGGGGASGRW